ncbi:MAG: allantoicase [Cocleimonas sp.]
MINAFKKNYINLASARLGAQAIYSTDDFFAPMERMLHDTDPVFIDDKFDDHGKWMDGWESRRKRVEGHDYCDVRLARSGFIYGVVVDTSHFTGNYPPQISLQACHSDNAPDDDTQWTTLIKKVAISGNEIKAFKIADSALYTHVRLHIYPDGGVARLRIYGEPQCNWDQVASDETKDLGAALNGGRAIACSDEHFGQMSNLLLPDKGINMGDGWETARRRGPGHDWMIIALGHSGQLKNIIVDTAFFKGNYPDRCSIQAACMCCPSDDIETESISWTELLPEQKLEMDREHHFSDEILNIGTVTHIRLNIFPDGGVSRLRLMGVIKSC